MTDYSEGSEPIKLTDKERIEKEAEEYADSQERRGCSFWTGLKFGYIAGAIAERERLTKEIEKLKSEIAALQSGAE